MKHSRTASLIVLACKTAPLSDGDINLCGVRKLAERSHYVLHTMILSQDGMIVPVLVAKCKEVAVNYKE